VDQLTALARKELLCLWRDPQLKIRLFQPIIYVAIFIILPIINKGDRASDGFYAQYTPFVSAAIVFLFLLTLAQNTLGMERQSLSTLFLFPIERKRLLWGKNLAVCLLGLVFLAALMLLCAALAREPEMILPASVIGVSGIAVALAWGNFASTYFPRYQPQVGRRGYVATGGQAQGNGGCLNQVMSLIMTIVTAITLAPVALAVGIPFFLNMSWLLGVTIPLSLLYGLAFYLILTHFSAKHMREREPEILMATTRD
jgi:hypothetical protein